MGRATATLGSPDCSPGVLDRSAGGVVHAETGADRSPALGPPRTESLLPGPAPGPTAPVGCPAPPAEPEVMLHQLWFQLSAPERQRFGHCFSAMVLKALGLPPSSHEVTS